MNALELHELTAQEIIIAGSSWVSNNARDPNRNLFGEGERDRPLSQLIAPEFIFECREKRPAIPSTLPVSGDGKWDVYSLARTSDCCVSKWRGGEAYR